MVTVAVAQFAPFTDKSANLAKIDALAARAADAGADLVVFPEYSSWFSPALDANALENAEQLDGAFVSRLKNVAARHGMTVVAGMTEAAVEEGEPEDRRMANTVVAVSSTAGVVASYRKVHLYDAFGACESDWIRPGDITAPETFVIGDLRFGLQTCYDLRFPETTRTLVDAGVDAVVLPAEWVAGPLKLDHWTTLIRARAIENTVFVVAADHTPPIGVGNSMIVDPRGEVSASIGDEAGIAVAEISRETILAVRERNPSLRMRRFAVVPA